MLLAIFVSATQSIVGDEGSSGAVAARPVDVDPSGRQLPAGFKVERYAGLWERDPFTMPSDAPTETLPSVFENLFLISWLNDRGKEVIYVQNSQTDEVQRITQTPNENNLRLLGVHRNSNPRLVDAVVAAGQEQGTVKFRFDLQVVPAVATPALTQNETNTSDGQALVPSGTAPRIYPGMRRVRSEGSRPSQNTHPKFPPTANPSIASQG